VRRMMVLLTGMVLASVVASGTAWAQTAPSGLLDAHSLPTPTTFGGVHAPVGGGVKQAQTFTATNSGDLSSAQVMITREDQAYSNPIEVQVTDVDASGMPGEVVLASASIPPSDVPLDNGEWPLPLTTVSFSSPAPVVAGEQYALVLDSVELDKAYTWFGGFDDYSEGQWPGKLYNCDGWWGQRLGERCEIGDWGIDGDFDAFFAIYVTPLNYDFSGFYQPVDDLPTLNKTKPGKTIPVRFSLEGDRGPNIFATGYPKSEPVACDSTAEVDGIEVTVAGKGGLRYDPLSDRYTYEWATNSVWSGCRQFVMKLRDGSVQRATFIFR
jgi:hypothetical protein